MHRLTIGLLLVLAFSSVAVAQEDSSPAIAILDFTGLNCNKDTAVAVSEILRTEIGSAGAFRVIERAQLEKVLAEQKFSFSELVDAKDAAKIGKLVGAKFVVIGSVSCLGSTYTVAARFIDVETAEMTLGKTLTCNNEGELPELCRQLASYFAGSIAGSIADPKVAVMEFMNAIKSLNTDKSWGLLSKARQDRFDEDIENFLQEYPKEKLDFPLGGKSNWIVGRCRFWNTEFGSVTFGETAESAKKGGKPNVAIGEAKVDGSKATVNIKKGDKPVITVYLVNESGWKIDSPIDFTLSRY